MASREENLGRRILFTNEDFEPLFAEEGIDFLSLNEEEWRTFEKMFGDGTQWWDVVKEAAWSIKLDREERNK